MLTSFSALRKIERAKKKASTGVSLVVAQLDTEVNIEEAKSMSLRLSKIKFAPSDIRPETAFGNEQGDHVTAYALYPEYVSAIVEKHILESTKSGPHITELLQDIRYREKHDQFLLKVFELQTEDEESLHYKELEDFITGLRDAYAKRITGIYTNALTIEELQGWQDGISEKDLSEKRGSVKSSSSMESELIAKINLLNFREKEASDLISKFDVSSLRETIQDLRFNYFFTVAQETAERYLRYQNQQRYVTFPRIDTQIPDKGEGNRVRWALDALRPYKSTAAELPIGFTSASSSSSAVDIMATSSGRPKRAKSKKNDLGKQSTSSLTTEKSEVDKIVDYISDLLFYPKLTLAEEQQIKNTHRDNARTNEENTLGFVIARHLSIIFKTFSRLGEDEERKKEIAMKFIDKIMNNWGISDNVAFKIKVVNLFDRAPIFEKAPRVSLPGSAEMAEGHKKTRRRRVKAPVYNESVEVTTKSSRASLTSKQ